MHKVVMPYFHTLIMKIDTLLKRHLTKENLIIMALWKGFLTFLRCICNFIWRNLCSDIISANFSPSDYYVLTSDFPLTMHSSRSLSMESQVMRWKERKKNKEWVLFASRELETPSLSFLSKTCSMSQENEVIKRQQ